jgi:hypothetical protein
LLDSDSAVQALRRVLASVASDIVAAAQRERALLAEYLAQEGCLSAGSLAFVDIGWQGSLQKAAAKLFARLAHPIRLEGLYFGTNDTVVAEGGPAGDMSGWFVESGQPAARYHLTRTQWAVLELLFTAEHGSVIGYRRGAAGKVEAVLDESPSAALPDYERAAGALQAAALEFVDRYIAAFGGLNPAPVSAADVAPLLERLALRPTLAEARAIGDLFHVDGFGATRTGQFIARPGSLRDPRRAMRDFRQASWRRGYLVRVFGGRRAALAAIAAIELARPGFKSA